MKSQTILVLFVLAIVYVSCAKVRMLQTTDNSIGIPNCKNFDKTTGTCLECFEGCTKWQNICVKVVKHCAKWNDQGDCTDCQTGYGDQSSKSINDSCPKQQSISNSTTVNNTTVGSSTGNQSIIESLVDVNCQCHNEQRVCIYCFTGYYLNINATCEQVPENCTAADANGQCTGCIQGFTVENGMCVEKICDKSLCVAFNADQTQCITCPQRSYLVNGCCYEVNGYCSQWIASTGECTTCYKGYELNKANKWQCIRSSA